MASLGQDLIFQLTTVGRNSINIRVFPKKGLSFVLEAPRSTKQTLMWRGSAFYERVSLSVFFSHFILIILSFTFLSITYHSLVKDRRWPLVSNVYTPVRFIFFTFIFVIFIGLFARHEK